jgi:DNA-binding CsgD family transcriptional regulator
MIDKLDELSDRELEILRLLATGASNKEIASQLFISPNTVKVHLRNIFSKIEVNSRTEAAMYAVNVGIITGTPESSESDKTARDESGLSPEGASTLSQKKWVWGLVGLSAVLLFVAVGMLFNLLNGPDDQNVPANLSETSRGWQSLKGMPTARHSLAVTAYEDLIYTIGGSSAQGVTGVVEGYDPGTDTWTPLSTKPTPVEQIQAEVLGGLIYVPGGRLDTGEVSDILEIYDPRQDVWTSGESLPMAVSAYALAAFEGQLYLFGGWDGDQYLATVYSYDPETNNWREEPDMPTARAFTGAGIAGRKIYIVGGFDGKQALTLSEVFIPDLIESESSSAPWSPANPLPEAVYAMGVSSVADVLYVVGGKADTSREYSALVYFDQTGEWQAFNGPEDGAEYGLGLTNLGVNLYAIGGSSQDSPLSNNSNYQVMYTVSFPIIVK